MLKDTVNINLIDVLTEYYIHILKQKETWNFNYHVT